jgi:hypothetical protein
MGSFKSRCSSLPHATRLGVAMLLLFAAFGSLAEVAGTQVAGAASAPTIANGTAGYTPTTTTPANQFNVLTLVSGGAASVNTASLTIVTQPPVADGTATAATTSTTGIINMTPASTATGTFSLTFAYCSPGQTYSAGNTACTTATLSYAASSLQYMGQETDGLFGVLSPINTAVVAPSTAPKGSVVTVTTAPVTTAVPATEDGVVTINYVSGITAITPIPTGFTYVAGSLAATGGDANTTGNFTATYCTAAVATYCTAQISTGNYLTTYPYIETILNPSVEIPGGDNISLPTVTAQFIASGAVGTVASEKLTEFLSTASATLPPTWRPSPSRRRRSGRP